MRPKLFVVLIALMVCSAPFAARALARSTVLATVQAETMTLPGGASVVASRSASGGQAVQLTQPGRSLTATVSLPSAATSVTLVAEGTRCQQGYPAVSAAVDGTTILNAHSVSNSSWTSYSASVSLGPGGHTLSVTDSATNACRTLLIDDITFSGPPTPAPTVSLTASPSSVASGGFSTLTWTSANATACTGSGAWSSSLPLSGSVSTGALTATATYALQCTGTGGTATAGATVTVAAPPPPKVCQSVVIPAYFYPSGGGGLWSGALTSEPGLGIMVANVNSGPGTSADPDYASAIARAQAAGVRVFGYVYTSYGSVSLQTVESRISAWKSLYGVTSIFLDEASTASSTLSYYQALTSFVHQQASGAQTIVNFGTQPPQSDMSAGDILVTFEGAYSTYLGLTVPSWMRSFAPTRFYNIIYNTSGQSSLAQVMTQASADNVGYVYVTDDTLPNPYDALPSYLSAETSSAQTGC